MVVRRDDWIDPPETLLGQLQRGLGRGYLAATREGAGAGELLSCIVLDPRWDRQLEKRASYYAKLALALELSPEPLARAVREGDPDSGAGGLAADVLAEMALRGHARARDSLRAELRKDGWLVALHALAHADAEHGTQLLERGDVGVVVERSEPEELKRLFFETGLPWREWGEHDPRLAGLLSEAGATEPPPPRPAPRTPDAASSTADLILLAESSNTARIARVLAQRSDPATVAALVNAAHGEDRDQRLVAFRALGAQGNPVLLEEVSRFLESDPGGRADGVRRSHALRYLEALPSDQTLPRARAWLGAGGGAAIAAERILARHARPEDTELVRGALAAALESGAVYRACSMVEALSVIADPTSEPLLVRVFERLPYSFWRSRVLRALRASGAETSQWLATEALWDCEPEARELGAEMTPLNDAARARLAEMAADPFEEERARSVAQSRLR